MATTRGKKKTQRQYTGPDGLPVVKEFVQRKGESERALHQRANEWQVTNRGKMPAPTMPLSRAIEIYMEYREEEFQSGELAKDTIKADRLNAKYLTAALGVQQINRVDAYGIDMALRAWKEKKRTALGIREYGRKLYKWLIARKWADSNPFPESKPIRYQPPSAEIPMSPEEAWGAIVRVSDPAARAVLSVLACTGLRPTGIRELLWSEIEEASGRLYIRKQKAKTPAGRAPVYVAEPAASILRSLPRTALFVFPNPKTGKPFGPTWLCDHWRAVRPHDRGPYDLKHFEVSRLADLGWTPRDIARRVGIKSARAIEQNYDQFNPARIAAKIETSEHWSEQPKKRAPKKRAN